MNKQNKIRSLHIIGIFFTLILGTLLHFTYEWSGNNSIVGFFSAVNESTIEHLKMIFVPFFLFSILEYFKYGKDISGFVFTKALCVSIGMIIIVVAFYLYTWILGTDFLWMDIAIFILGIVTAYFVSYKLLKNQKVNHF